MLRVRISAHTEMLVIFNTEKGEKYGKVLPRILRSLIIAILDITASIKDHCGKEWKGKQAGPYKVIVGEAFT